MRLCSDTPLFTEMGLGLHLTQGMKFVGLLRWILLYVFAFLSGEFGSEPFNWDLRVPFPSIFILKHVNTLVIRSFMCSSGVYYFLSI